jgi:hypothetical protein
VAQTLERQLADRDRSHRRGLTARERHDISLALRAIRESGKCQAPRLTTLSLPHERRRFGCGDTTAAPERAAPVLNRCRLAPALRRFTGAGAEA